MWKLTMALVGLMEFFPNGSQEFISRDETIIVARLYDICHWTNWRISEYDPVSKQAYGYTKTIYWLQGWWFTQINELEVLTVSLFPIIQLDEYFKPTKFKNLSIN